MPESSHPLDAVPGSNRWSDPVDATRATAKGTVTTFRKHGRRRTNEWVPEKRWNPFNSYKLLVHVERWRAIKRGRPIPPPVLITVDPTNQCNYNCVWCNAAYIRKRSHSQLSGKLLSDLANFLPRWGKVHSMPSGVQAICVAGGGEPLLNPATAAFIDQVVINGIEVGVVTNGSLIREYIDPLSQCTWVGVSMDAGSAETYQQLKRLKDRTGFSRVVESIAKLADYAKRHNTRLGMKHPAYGLSYKFLLYRENIAEVFAAARLAKELGCKNIHFRPAGTAWNKIGSSDEIAFSKEDVALFNEQIALAQELDDETFGVYGVTHKFNAQFNRSNCFDKCYSIFMTAVVSPVSNQKASADAFVMGLCCDRRGDKKLELLVDCEDVERIGSTWGSHLHWRIHDLIDVDSECPRCTYQPHNQIFEQVILNDTMTYKFI
jgi:MoaA/NifB/PqqE/SkfB family radical SAM enzyme